MANITPGDWQRIGYWQIANTGNNTIYVSLNAKVVSQSIDNNTSTVATLLNIDVIGSGSYNTYSVKAGLTGGSDISWGYSTITNGKTLIQGQFICSHASDGTCNAEIGCWVTQTFGGSLGYTSVWVALPTIPRASQPSINTWPSSSPNITAGTACTIHMNRKSTSFTHKVTYSIGSASGTIANSGVTDNVSWTPSTNLCAQFPNAKSKSGTITVTTYNGSTTVGTKTCTFNLSIPSGSNPTLSEQTVTEQNSYVKAKDESITLHQISSKSVSVKASAKYSASVSKVTCNGVSLSNSSGTWSGKLSNLSTGTFTFTVTDTRGLTSSVNVSTTYYEYAKPQLTEGDLKREEQTSSIGALTVKGTYKDVLSNTVTMTYERKVNGASEGQSSVTPTVSGGSVSYSQSYTDLHYTNSYDVVITITDSFGESTTATIHLGVGQYALWLGKTDAKVGGDLAVGGDSTVGGSTTIGGDLTVGGKIHNAGLTLSVRLVAEGYFNNEATLYADSNYSSHRFRTCYVYDSTYFHKVHDSDNWEYLVCDKSRRFLVVANTAWANDSGVYERRLAITNNSSGTHTWDFTTGETVLTSFTIHFGFTKAPYIGKGNIIKWVAGTNHTVQVSCVDVQIFAIE